MYSILDNQNLDEYGPVICSVINSQQSCNTFHSPSESNTGNSKILNKISFMSMNNTNERNEAGIHKQQIESDSMDQWLEKMNDMLWNLRSTVKQQVVLDAWTDVLLKTCLSFLSAIRTNHSLRQLMETPMSFIIDYEQLRKEPFSKVELLSIPQPYLDEDCDLDPKQTDRLWLNLSSPNICKLWMDNDELKGPRNLSDKGCESLRSLSDSVVRTNYLRRQRQQKGHKLSHENVQIPYFKAKELLGSLLNVIDGFSARYGEGLSENGMVNCEKYFPEAHGEWTKRLFPYHTNLDQGVLSAQIPQKSIEEGQQRLRANGYPFPYLYPPIITEPPPTFRPIRPFQILYPPPQVPYIRHGHHQMRFQYGSVYSQGLGAAYHPSSSIGQSIQVANCQATQQLIIRVPPPPLPQMMPHVNCYMPIASTVKNYIPQSLMVPVCPSNFSPELPAGSNIANSYHAIEHTAHEFTTAKNNRVLKSFQTLSQNKIYTWKNDRCCPESSNWESLKNTGYCDVNACSCRIESLQETYVRTPWFPNVNSHASFVTNIENCNSEAMILQPEPDMQTETFQNNHTQRFESGKSYSVTTPTLMNIKLQSQSLTYDTVSRITNNTTPNSKITKNNLAYNKRNSVPELNITYNNNLANQNYYGHRGATTVKLVHQSSGIKNYSSTNLISECNESNIRKGNYHHCPNNSQYFTFPLTRGVKEELKLTTNKNLTNSFVPSLTSLDSIKKLQNQSYNLCEAENSFHLRLEKTEQLNNIYSTPAFSAGYDKSKDNEKKAEDCCKTNEALPRTQTAVSNALLKDKHVVRYEISPSSVNNKTFRTLLLKWKKRKFSKGKLKLLVYYITEKSSDSHNKDIIAKKKINKSYLKVKSRSITLKFNHGKWVRKKVTAKRKISHSLKSRNRNLETSPFPINISFYKHVQRTVDKPVFPLYDNRKFTKFSSQFSSTDDFKSNPTKRLKSCGNILSPDCKRCPQKINVEIPTAKNFEVVDDSFFDCDDIQKLLNENFLIKPWCPLNEKINGWLHFKIALQTVLKNCCRLLQEVSLNENREILYKF
ncbi:uncharacterized protein LOC118203263 [Stegodyphus dumicola]|uniref:uncharacterized protein LOC118203263 n=1 Tax=Stegodyphus dumicola TaxID=202533 RepID=UPI0015ABFDCA|nr:uncharacterized protein LOC118203263 [Stegodyphus dumicola]